MVPSFSRIPSFLRCIYLKVGVAEKEREIFISYFTPQTPAGIETSRLQEQEAPRGAPTWVARPKHLDLHLLPWQAHWQDAGSQVGQPGH